MRIASLSVTFVLAAGVAGLAAAEPIPGQVEGLKPGHWLRVAGSALQTVAPPSGAANVIDPWSGGAFDTKRDQLIVWGGGHGDYSGNEIYTFSLNTLKWTRVNNPSQPPAKDTAYAADGGPCSRHTYNYVQYLPAVDRFVSFGGAGFWQSGQTGTNHTDAFDFETRKWSKLADVPERAFGIGAFSAVDPNTGHAWQHGAGGKCLCLAEYLPDKNAWVARGGQWTEGENDFSYNLTAAVDSKRKLFVACGGGAMWTWNIAAEGALKGAKLETSGDNAIVKAASPGFEYHAKSDRMVAWSGGADVYLLNMDTKAWTKVAPSPGNTVTPTAAAKWGTFGRFRYSPNKDVFVVVNSISEDVFIYRLPAAGDAPAGNPAK
ncbi:MAG TPA: kelch repeat-containing protein [Planctomycetota bacterium]|nr:kelch repeat-containing protein [Planctomycetota bacterium]